MTWRWPSQPKKEQIRESTAIRQASPRHAAGHEPPPAQPEATALEISHAQMSDAVCAGTAVPLGLGFPWVVRYLDAWWVEYEGGWLRVIDDHVTAELDDVAARLAEAAIKGQRTGPLVAAGLEERWPRAWS
jgi:hypothetical protein